MGPTSIIAPDFSQFGVHFIVEFWSHVNLCTRFTMNAVVFDCNLVDMGVHRYNFFLHKISSIIGWHMCWWLHLVQAHQKNAVSDLPTNTDKLEKLLPRLWCVHISQSHKPCFWGFTRTLSYFGTMRSDQHFCCTLDKLGSISETEGPKYWTDFWSGERGRRGEWVVGLRYLVTHWTLGGWRRCKKH